MPREHNLRPEEQSFQSLLALAFSIQEYNDRKLPGTSISHRAERDDRLNRVEGGPDLNLKGVGASAGEGLDGGALLDSLERQVDLPVLAIDSGDGGGSKAAMFAETGQSSAPDFVPNLGAPQEQIGTNGAIQLIQDDDPSAVHGAAAALIDAISDDQLQEIAQQAVHTTQATGSAIALLVQGKLICRATAGNSASEIGAVINTGSGFAGICASSGRIQMCSNTTLESRLDADAYWKIGIRAIIVAPLFHQHQLFGVIAAVSREPYAFGMRDVQRLQDIAENFTANLPVNLEPANSNTGDQPTAATNISSPERATEVVRDQRKWRFAQIRLHRPGLRGSKIVGERLPPARAAQNIKRLVRFLIVRYWTPHEGELSLMAPAGTTLGESVATLKLQPDVKTSEDSRRKFGIRRIVALAVPITVIVVVLGWWHWQQGWAELEARLPAKKAVVQPRLKVPADVMARRIVYQVTPEYPALARRSKVRGTVVLAAVVSVEGAVTQVKFVSGPEALSQAALDAVRWWRYEPYSVNGQPSTVETTVAVDFRLPN